MTRMVAPGNIVSSTASCGCCAGGATTWKMIALRFAACDRVELISPRTPSGGQLDVATQMWTIAPSGSPMCTLATSGVAVALVETLITVVVSDILRTRYKGTPSRAQVTAPMSRRLHCRAGRRCDLG